MIAGCRRHLLYQPGTSGFLPGWLRFSTSNPLGCRHLGGWMERLRFSKARDRLPLHPGEIGTHQLNLSYKLGPAVLLSCFTGVVLLASTTYAVGVEPQI